LSKYPWLQHKKAILKAKKEEKQNLLEKNYLLTPKGKAGTHSLTIKNPVSKNKIWTKSNLEI